MPYKYFANKTRNLNISHTPSLSVSLYHNCDFFTLLVLLHYSVTQSSISSHDVAAPLQDLPRGMWKLSFIIKDWKSLDHLSNYLFPGGDLFQVIIYQQQNSIFSEGVLSSHPENVLCRADTNICLCLVKLEKSLLMTVCMQGLRKPVKIAAWRADNYPIYIRRTRSGVTIGSTLNSQLI